jgi:threonyl-tRNA synthetase
MAATYASVLQQMMVSFMRWPLQIGLPAFNWSSDKTLHLPRPVISADYPALEKLSESAVKDKQKFERLVISKEKLLEMFNVWFLLYPFQNRS